MKYKRFFAFGCSFTNYFWPTWADIIAHDLQIPSQNWGISGLGNVAIATRMIECDIKNTFTPDDLIVVLWSTWHREDRFLNNDWTLCGNVFNFTHYDKAFCEKYWSIENDIIKNASAIIGANKMFDIQSQAHISEMFHGIPDNDMYTKEPLFEFYAPHLPKTTFPWHLDNIPFDGYLTADHHPDINAHLHYVKDFIYKDANITLKQDTIEHYTDLHNEIVDRGKNGEMKNIKPGGPEIANWFKKRYNHFPIHLGFPHER